MNYKFDLNKQHNFDILVGTEYGESRPDFGFSLSANTTNSVFGDLTHAYMDFMKDRTAATVSGSPNSDSRSMSYFGRVNYNFNEKYMLSAIMRADGNSNSHQVSVGAISHQYPQVGLSLTRSSWLRQLPGLIS